jgi:hypothetical protein
MMQVTAPLRVFRRRRSPDAPSSRAAATALGADHSAMPNSIILKNASWESVKFRARIDLALAHR